ncbi:MAG: phosphatase PAP2 family protein [Chlorobiales bacterium]|nr:phosphatase PAP2 family protein [Chlorobiales bacterium]
MLAFLFASIQLSERSGFFQTLRNIAPIVLIPPVFSLTYKLVPLISPYFIDDRLIQIDYMMFGVNPTEWLMRISNPLLTEWLQLAYVLFYLVTIITSVVLLRQKRYKEFQAATFLVVYGFLLSYIGYFFTPAVGPRYTLHNIALTDTELPGIFMAEPLRNLLLYLEGPLATNTFPSGHTDLTLCSLYIAWMYDKKLFKIMLPIGLSIIFATVYLRYHYVIDLIGGAIFFVFTVKTSPYFQNWIEKQVGDVSSYLRGIRLPEPSPQVLTKMQNDA